MIFSILLGVNILAIALNAWGAWPRVRPKDKDEMPGSRREQLLVCAAAIVAIMTSLVQGSDWGAALFSHQSVLNSEVRSQRATNMPNCTLTGIAIRPSDPIKHLQMVVFLQTPIYNYTLIREQHGINVRTEVDFPCDIKGQSSDPDDRLTFTISPDRKQILVIGHDLSSYDDQTLLLTFYPDPQWNEDAGRLTSDGSATYVAHGREIPARIKWISR